MGARKHSQGYLAACLVTMRYQKETKLSEITTK